MKRHLAAIPVLIGALLSGCGLAPLGDSPGGDRNLPTLGAGPYTRLPFDPTTPADEPFVFSDPVADLVDPAVLPLAGGGYRFWLGRRQNQVEEIWTADLADLGALPGLLQPALRADAAWEQGRVAAPSVVEVGSELFLYYEGGAAGAPGLGVARSSDGGQTWVKHPGNPLVADAARPGAAVLEGRVVVFFADPGGGRLFRVDASPTDPTSFASLSLALTPLAGDPGFAGRPLSDPCPVIRRTAAGRVHHGLFFVGLGPANPPGEPNPAIGFAGSFDGVSWERFGAGAPVLSERPPPEAGPAAVLEPSRGVLFFHQVTAGRARIAAATAGGT